jgi:hypothetical protein
VFSQPSQPTEYFVDRVTTLAESIAHAMSIDLAGGHGGLGDGGL